MSSDKIEILSERLNTFMETTTEYRKSLCSKIDALNTKLDGLPCSKGHDFHVDRQLGAIWWIVSICLIGMVSIGVAWGEIHNQVRVNTERWDRVLQEQSHGKVHS